MSCHYHAQGCCGYGTACKFNHDIQDGAPNRAQCDESTKSSPIINRTSNRKSRRQRKGKQSPSQPEAVGTPLQRTISQRPASIEPSQGSEGGKSCHPRKVGTCTSSAKCQDPHEHGDVDDHPEQTETEAQLAAQARATETAKEAAAKTVQGVMLGSIATFGTGLEISHLVTGFECCTVRIANLPPNVREHEVIALITERGLDRGRFHLKPMASGGNISAEIVTDAESGKALSLDLDGLEFRGKVLTLKVSGFEQNADVLTILWLAPSVSYVAEYPATVTASERAQKLNRRVCFGRRVTVKRFKTHSIKIKSLPPSVTDEEVRAFSGSDSVKLLQAKGKVPVQDVGNIATILRDDIEQISPGTVRSMKPSHPIPNIDGVTRVCVQFTSQGDAHMVHTRIRKHRIGKVSFWSRLSQLPSLTDYSITISRKQFRAQKVLWDALVDSIEDKSSCMLHIHEQSGVVQIRISGSKKEAIGALKIRVERLIAGENVDGWHRELGSSSNAFLRSVFDDTGAFLRADWRRHILKIYGQPEAVEQARELVKAELDRLSSVEYTRKLPKDSVQFFAQYGLPELKEDFGEENIKFDVSTMTVTISGGEEARHALKRLIHHPLRGMQILPALPGQQSCPLCHDNISSPFHLGCGHVYCAACMRHFLTSALNLGQFPLTCMGDESQCRVPIPIPTIKQFLPPASFSRLLEVAFNAYISRNPGEFKYCRTPDCTQIYRSTDANSATVGQCPSCFSKICTSCHEDVHDGMGCDEHKQTERLVEEERQTDAWTAAQGELVRKCPSCRVLIEKVSGCNHITCTLCHSHVCWRCMGIFTADTIYEHMRNEHDAIHDDDDNDDDDDAGVAVDQWFHARLQEWQERQEWQEWFEEEGITWY